MNVLSHNKIGVIALSALAVVISTAVYADVPTPLAEGVTFNVTGTGDAAVTACTETATDTYDCTTLRDAVAFANGNGNGLAEYDVINLPAGTIALTETTGLQINEPVEIVGAGVDDTTIDGAGIAERIFTVNGVLADISEVHLTNGSAINNIGGAILNDEASTLSLSNCAITNSVATWDGVSGTEENQGHGGAIYSKDKMYIDNCVFRGNEAKTIVEGVKNGNGGAIYASQSTEIANSTFGSDSAIDADSNEAINGGAVFMTGGNPNVISNSTFSYNDAISGGGINVVAKSAGMRVDITNSTISGNHVTDSGAGVETNAPMYLTNVTIANNMKDSNNKGAGYNTGPDVPVTFRNVLLDNNLHDGDVSTGFTESSNCGLKSPGVFNLASQGGNISSDDTCQLNASLGDQEDTDPLLESLADNNAGLTGTTLTHALPLNSPAVDTGVNTDCPNNDQRGSMRPFDATLLQSAVCDSGAYELYVERSDLHIENMVAPDKVTLGDDLTIDITVDNGSPSTTIAATNTVLVTMLPAELTYGSSAPSQGSCIESSGVVTCDFGDLAPDAEASVSIAANASTLKSDVVVETSVTTDSADPIADNNYASVSIDIVAETTETSSSDGGGFCSYNPNGRFDPLLPSLILMAIGALFYRRARG